MKQLPDQQTLLELLEMARFASEKAKSMADLATEIDDKWRVRLEKKRLAAIQNSSKNE